MIHNLPFWSLEKLNHAVPAIGKKRQKIKSSTFDIYTLRESIYFLCNINLKAVLIVLTHDKKKKKNRAKKTSDI